MLCSRPRTGPKGAQLPSACCSRPRTRPGRGRRPRRPSGRPWHSPATVAAITAGRPAVVASARHVLGATSSTGPTATDAMVGPTGLAAGPSDAPVGSASQPVNPGAMEAGIDALEAPIADASASTGGPPSGSTDLTLFPGLSPLCGMSMPPTAALFSATAFLRGRSSRPTFVAGSRQRPCCGPGECQDYGSYRPGAHVCGYPRLGARAHHG
jgi:hypothetical protein